MKFENNLCFFISPNDRYGLTRKNITELTKNDFTLRATFKVDWGKNNNEHFSILCKSGMHMGIFTFKDVSNYFIQGIVWLDVDNKKIPFDISIQIPNEKIDEIFDVTFTVSQRDKKIKLDTRWNSEEKTFKGNLIDYTYSWVWVGVGNGHKATSQEHKNHFIGEIYHVSAYDFITEDESKLNIENSFFYTNFKEMTYYKVRDLGINGNNLTKYHEDWFEN